MEQSNIHEDRDRMVSRLSTGTKLVKTQSQFCAVITNTRTHAHTHTHTHTHTHFDESACAKGFMHEKILV